MPKFSIKKLNELKDAKGYTIKELAQITEIPHSTMSKIFAGINNNPSIETVQKIASALDCGLDDFIEYEVEPKSAYYTDRQTAKIAQEIYENKNLRIYYGRYTLLMRWKNHSLHQRLRAWRSLQWYICGKQKS